VAVVARTDPREQESVVTLSLPPHLADLDAFPVAAAARVAQAYGEHPEIAVLRMRWARAAVAAAFGGAHPALTPAPSARPVHRSGICRAA
jgi:hypothetical protein